MSRSDARILFGIGGVLFAGALLLLALVGVSLRTGRLDTRAKHSVLPDPVWMSASQEPLWFYGIIGVLTLLAVYLLILSWRMMREARRDHPR